MSDFIIQFLTSIIASAGFTAFIAYLFKDYLSSKIKGQIKYEYDLKLDSHKNELQRQSNSELEELKNSLKISEIKSTIQLSHLHEKQADKIDNIHKYMWELFLALNEYTTFFQARKQSEHDEKRIVVADKLDQLKNYHQLNSIYMSESLSKTITSVIKEIQTTAFAFMNHVESKDENMMAEWDLIHAKVNNQIKKGIDDLANEFRDLLGAS